MPKQKKFIIIFAAILILCTLTLTLLILIPIGKSVLVNVSVTPGTISINGYSIRDAYFLHSDLPASSEYNGDRALFLRVFLDQTEIATIRQANITKFAGNYAITTPTLPQDLKTNTNLILQVQLFDEKGNLVAEDQTTILYK